MMSTEKLAADMGAGKFAKPIEDACIRWGIVSGRDKARFIAQLHVESQRFTRAEENLRYTTPERLVAIFGKRNGLTLAKARELVRLGPMAIGNFVYGGIWGREILGNTQPGDGWNFRGRGLIQNTGRDNYRRASMGCYGDLRLLDNPDILLDPHEAANVSGWYWYDRRLNGIEDIGFLTGRINVARLELDERVRQTNRAYRLLESQTS